MTEALLRLQSVQFEGAGTYRRSTGPIALAKRGRVLICGEEGAGKSMIPEVMTLALYGKGSPRVRSKGSTKALAESTIVNEVTGYLAELSFDAGLGAAARHVLLTQAFKHKRYKSKYAIAIDGQKPEDLPTGKPEQKKLIKQLVPISYEEWLGVVYMCQGGIHELLSGSPTEKRDYLTSVFGMDFYDDLHTEAEAQRKELEKFGASGEDIQRQRKDIEEQLHTVEEALADMPARDEIEAAVEKFSSKLQALSKALGTLESTASTVSKKKALLAERARFPEWQTKAEVELALKMSRGLLQAGRDQVSEATIELKNVEAQRKAYDRAKSLADDTAAKYAAMQKRRHAAEERASEQAAREYLNQARLILREADALGMKVIDSGKVKMVKDVTWQEAATQAQQEFTTLDRLTKMADKLEGHRLCPTCTHPVGDIEGLLRSARAAHQKALNKASCAIIEELRNVALAVPNGSKVKDLHMEVMAGLQTHEDVVTLLAHEAGALEAHEQTRESLASLQKPGDTESLERKAEKGRVAIREAEKLIERDEEALSIFQKLEALGHVDVADEAELQKRLDEVNEKKTKTNEKYRQSLSMAQEHDSTSATRKALKKQLKALDEKIDAAADMAVRLKGYEDILIPYFTALRAAKVRSCISVLEGVLPIYVNAMADAQYKGAEVKLEVSDDLKDIDLLLRTGLHQPWLRPLQNSGGQRQRFSLAIKGALREVSPRKANVMFFDEPFLYMQGEGKMLFLNRMLPILMERCPDLESIFVVAHDQEVLHAANDTFDSVWNVTRDEAGSAISMGNKLSMVVGR